MVSLKLKQLLLLAWLSSGRAEAFVLLSGADAAKLPVQEASPTLTFLLSPDPPPISSKEKFLDGSHASLSDQEFWLLLVETAMQAWNGVPYSYVELVASTDAQASLNEEDQQFSIVVGSTNLSSSAYARPKWEGSLLYDCDIAVSERGSSAENLAYTLLHELGHCLGLGHNHADYNVVMGYSRLDRSLNLGLDDEAGLIYLYPSSTVGESQEMIACGVLGAAHTQRGTSLWLLAIPLAAIATRRNFVKVCRSRQFLKM